MGSGKAWGDAMTDWITVTAACPAKILGPGNHLAMALGRCAEDGETYAQLTWQDGAGNRYAVASWSVPAEWVYAAQGKLAHPTWDVTGLIDMDSARAAQSTMRVAVEPTPATPDRLTVILGMQGIEALAAMGLRPVPSADVW